MNFPFSIPHGREIDAVGFGTNAVDFLIRVPVYPQFTSKIELIDYSQAPGGEAASTMVGLRRLGLSSRYVGRFGSDPAGTIGLNSLRDENVDVSFAQAIEGAATQIAFIIIDETSGERTVIWRRDPQLYFFESEAPVGAVESCRVLHMTPHDTRACIKLAETAKDKGTIVSLDIDDKFDNMDELLELVDVLIASADLPQKLLGPCDKHEGLKEMHARYGSGIVGVTLGENGSLVLCGNKFIETPGFQVPGGCKDTTGAGDSFRVGLLYGMLTGESVEESCRMANAVASLKCRAVGARTALPTSDELANFLRARS